MSKLVTPKTYLTGYTTLNKQGLEQYLIDTDQTEFLEEIAAAYQEGLSDGEVLCSFYAKLCYSALTTKKNKNISKVRCIYDNILGTIDSGHGSVFEHCYINFVTTNCSRVFTHELCRHRVGSSYSQTSGRYVRSDKIDFIHDPILDPVKDEIIEGLNYIENLYKKMEDKMGINEIKDFSIKKKITSALRRICPNGQSNEMGFGLNLRSLRHLIELRTSIHAEWEIRLIFNQIYELVKDKYPAIFEDAKVEWIENANQITFKNKKI